MKDPALYMFQLCESFPTLRDSGAAWASGGRGVAWHPMRFVRWILFVPNKSDAAKHAARFILGVWNRSDWRAYLLSVLSGMEQDDEASRILQELQREIAGDVGAERRQEARDAGRPVTRGAAPLDDPEVQGRLLRRLDQVHRFDALEALMTWDEAHRAAFLAWAADPRWP